MKLPPPGEIWAIQGADDAQLSCWCEQIAHMSGGELLSFAQQAKVAQDTGWYQARYYSEEGQTVQDFLSYNAVYEINPFAVGMKRPESKREFRARLHFLIKLMGLQPLLDSPLMVLSTGEMRRTLLARVLAKKPQLLILDNPAAGMDVARRDWLKGVLDAFATRGTAILFVGRHADEAPASAHWFQLTRTGNLQAIDSSAVTAASCAKFVRKKISAHDLTAKPIVEIHHLKLAYGARTLFNDFSWTIREGERWALRGQNGSGKTTLLALIMGDSPFAYAVDIRVFGQAREMGCELRKIRSKIGFASSDLQAYKGLSAEAVLANALRKNPKLLLLDEPFQNLSAPEIAPYLRRLNAYLKAHPKVAAIFVSHREDEVPVAFTHELSLDIPRGKGNMV